MSDVRPEDQDQDQAQAEGAEVPSAEAAEDDDATSVESLVADLERVVGERDQYLALAQSKQAEFENYKKRIMKQQADHLAHAAAALVEKLLPVLDAMDAGVAHGDESVAAMRSQLLGVLEKEGLARIDPVGEAFDPNDSEAVASEDGDGGEPTVAETFRAGYRWNGRLLRPAMVRVRH